MGSGLDSRIDPDTAGFITSAFQNFHSLCLGVSYSTELCVVILNQRGNE